MAIRRTHRVPAREARPLAAASAPAQSGAGAAVRVLVPRAPVARRGTPPLPLDERERRSHIRRWASLMIVHLERSDFDDARHYSYEEALERLKELVERELESVRAEA